MNIWLAIINPAAGFHTADKKWKRISSLLKKADIPFVPVLTFGPNETINKTLDGIGKGFRKILVIGGDGTLNEVVNAVFLSGIPSGDFMIGAIPTGAGNDWSRMHKISSNPEKAIFNIKKEKCILHDVGRVEYFQNKTKESRLFMINAGLGYDAVVVAKVNSRSFNIISGPLNYLFTVLTTLFKYKNHKVLLNIDGELMRTEGISINVGICKYKGAGMLLMPYAIPDDGLFDLTLIRKMGRWRVFMNLRKLYKGNVLKLPEILSKQCEKVELISEEKLVMETDGETIYGESPYVFTILPKALRMVIASN